jgi:hypothetical protein
MRRGHERRDLLADFIARGTGDSELTRGAIERRGSVSQHGIRQETRRRGEAVAQFPQGIGIRLGAGHELAATF